MGNRRRPTHKQDSVEDGHERPSAKKKGKGDAPHRGNEENGTNGKLPKKGGETEKKPVRQKKKKKKKSKKRPSRRMIFEIAGGCDKGWAPVPETRGPASPHKNRQKIKELKKKTKNQTGCRTRHNTSSKKKKTREKEKGTRVSIYVEKKRLCCSGGSVGGGGDGRFLVQVLRGRPVDGVAAS